MKCAIYTRVSTKNKEQEQSLQNQKELLLDVVKKNGWEIYDFYEDIRTATKKGRVDFNRMVEDVKQKKFDIILSKELSRLARNMTISAELKEIALENNVKICTLDGASNLKDETNMYGMYGIYSWIYENESQDTSRRIKSAFRCKNMRGEPTTRAPFGYILKNKKLIIREDETPSVVKRIFKEYISGKSTEQIARTLTKEQIITPAQVVNNKNAGVIWYGRTILLILQNRAYIGDTVGHKQETISANTYKRKDIAESEQIIVKNTHQAIILKEDFFVVQDMLQKRSKNKGFQPKPNSHLFSGLLFCADCGKGMHYKANRKGYVCGAFDKFGTVLCTSHIVKEKDLEEKILEDLNLIISNKKNLKDMLFKKIEVEKQKINKEILQNKRKIEDFKTLKVEALTKFISNQISKEDYNLFISSINVEDLEYRTVILEQKIKILNETNHFQKISNMLGDTKIKTLTKEILNKLVKKIEIKENGNAIIYYSFQNPFQKNLLEVS